MRRRAGFTIIELIIVGGVVFVLLGGVSVVLAETSRQAWNRTDSRMVSLQGAQRALDRISEDLREASRSTITLGPPDCIVDRLAFTPIGATEVEYTRANNGRLSRTQNNVTTVVAAGLTGFNPTCNANGLTRLEVTAQYTSPDGVVATESISGQVWVQSP